MSRTRIDSVDLAAAVASSTVTVPSTQVVEVTNMGDRVIYSGSDPLNTPEERIAPGETVVLTDDFKLGAPIGACKAQLKFVTPSVPNSVASTTELAKGRVQGELTKTYGLVAGVIRNYDDAADGSGSSGWELLTDGFHPPIGITAVDSLSDTALIEITYDDLLTVGAERTVSLIAAVDETLAKAGFSCGCSVEPGVARIQLYQTRRASDYVYYDTGSASYKLWKTENGTGGETSPFTVESATSNHLSLTHTQVKKVDRFDHVLQRIGGPGENYLPVLSTSNQPNDTQRVVIDFYDDGQLVEGRPARVTTPDTKCRAIVSRGEMRTYTPPNEVNQTTYPNGNIWIFGVMQMEA